jgi:hypothetical protein
VTGNHRRGHQRRSEAVLPIPRGFLKARPANLDR